VTGIPTILSDYWISNDNAETGPWDPNPPPLKIVTLCNYMYICESAEPKHLLFPVIGLWLRMLCYDINIAEILLKLALNTNQSINQSINRCSAILQLYCDYQSDSLMLINYDDYHHMESFKRPIKLQWLCCSKIKVITLSNQNKIIRIINNSIKLFEIMS
jgi:hypothetical protein